MKGLALLLLLAGMSYAQQAINTSGARSRSHESVMNVTQTCVDTQAIYGVVVSSQTPTVAVDGGLVPYKTASVENLDATANLYWHYSASVSSITSGVAMATATVGIKITPAQLLTFSLLPGVSYYMLNDSATKSVNAIVSPCR